MCLWILLQSNYILTFNITVHREQFIIRFLVARRVSFTVTAFRVYCLLLGLIHTSNFLGNALIQYGYNGQRDIQTKSKNIIYCSLIILRLFFFNFTWWSSQQLLVYGWRSNRDTFDKEHGQYGEMGIVRYTSQFKLSWLTR